MCRRTMSFNQNRSKKAIEADTNTYQTSELTWRQIMVNFGKPKRRQTVKDWFNKIRLNMITSRESEVGIRAHIRHK